MAGDLRVVLEHGPKGKRVVAVALDWPGLSRAGKTADAALERLTEYLPRYAPVARLAGMEDAFAAAMAADIDVVETYQGTGSTDFWGISFATSPPEQEPMTEDELERNLALMQASWAYFDDVHGRVSEVLRKGPRGGGRDRDNIFRHVVLNEADWAKGVGSQTSHEDVVTDAGLAAHRAGYCAGIRAAHAEGRKSGTWTLRFLIRHTAYHNLDHAWEMEDKDLTGEQA